MLAEGTNGNIPEFIKEFYGYVENGGEWVYNNIIVPVQSFAEEVAEDIDNFDIENIIQVCLGNMTQICEAVYIEIIIQIGQMKLLKCIGKFLNKVIK